MNDVKINRDLVRWLVLGLGVIALIVMAVALLATPQNRFNTVSYVALGVAILGLAGFVLLDPQAVIDAVMGRTGQYAITTWLMTLFFVAFVVAAFVLIKRAEIPPWDLTEAQRYRLSDETIELLQNLEEDVHVVGFFTDAQENQRKEAEIWLQRYRQYSNGHLTYEFVDPDRNPGEASRLGMTRVGVLVFEQGDRTAEAPFADERNLTGALVRVLAGEPRKAYFLTGHGEREINDFSGTGFSQARELLSRSNFEVETLNLLEEASVPEDADLVIIAGPTVQYTDPEVEALKEYLDGGGSLLVLSDPGTGGGSLGNGVLSVDYNSDGTRLATAGADGTVKVWDVRTGEETLALQGHGGAVVNVSFRPDGRQIATAGVDGTVRIWDARTGEELQQLEGQTDMVVEIAYSPDGSLLASVGQDQIVNVWDATTYELLDYSPITTPVPLFALAFSPDGSQLAATGARNTPTGGVSGLVFVWDTDTGEELVNQSLHSAVAFDIAFSPDGETVHTVALDGTEGTLDVETGEGNTVNLYPDAGLIAFAIMEDGTRIYALGDNTIHVRPPDATSTSDDIILTGHTNTVQAISLSPDGDHFATGSRDGTTRIWSLSEQETVLTLRGHSATDALLAYLRDEWGIVVNDDLAVDLLTAREFDEVTPVIYSYDATSPITAPLVDAQLRTFLVLARSLTIEEPPAEVVLTPLLFSSGQAGSSWGETDPFGGLQFDEQDIPGPLVLGVSGENPTTGARIVVIGDADFASNDALDRTAYGNSELLMNAVNWLTESENLIDLPGPEVGERVIDNPLSPAGLIVTSIAAICLAPLGAIVAGAAVWISRRQRR